MILYQKAKKIAHYTIIFVRRFTGINCKVGRGGGGGGGLPLRNLRIDFRLTSGFPEISNAH